MCNPGGALNEVCAACGRIGFARPGDAVIATAFFTVIATFAGALVFLYVTKAAFSAIFQYLLRLRARPSSAFSARSSAAGAGVTATPPSAGARVEPCILGVSMAPSGASEDRFSRINQAMAY